VTDIGKLLWVRVWKDRDQ